MKICLVSPYVTKNYYMAAERVNLSETMTYAYYVFQIFELSWADEL